MKKLTLNILMCLLVGCGLFVIGGEVRAECICTKPGGACVTPGNSQCAGCLSANSVACAGVPLPCEDETGSCPSSFPPAEECTKTCGYPGGTASNGLGGNIICPPTAACPKPEDTKPVGTPTKPATAAPTATTANSCDCQAVCASDNYGTACSACEASCLSAPATTPVSASTQGNIPNPNKDSGSGVSITDPLNLNSKTPIVTLANKLINIILGLTGVLALLSFIYGGILYMLASVNPDNVKKGKEVMKWSIVGLFIIFSAYAILNFLLVTVLGLK